MGCRKTLVPNTKKHTYEQCISAQDSSAFSECSATPAISVSSAPAVSAEEPSVHIAEKELDEWIFAAIICGDRTAAEHIVAAAATGNHLAEASLSRLFHLQKLSGGSPSCKSRSTCQASTAMAVCKRSYRKHVCSVPPSVVLC